MKVSPLSRLLVLPVIGAAALAVPTAAQTTKLIATGDVLPGLGFVQTVREFDVNAGGDWVASVNTYQMPGVGEFVIVRNGLVVLDPADVVPWYSIFPDKSHLSLGDAGEFGWQVGFSGLSSLYGGTEPCLLIGDPIAGAGLLPGTTCEGVFSHVFEPGGTLLASVGMATGLAGPGPAALVRAAPHGAGLTATSIVKKGDVLPGHAHPVLRFAIRADTMASNATGSVMYVPEFDDGAQGIYLNGQKLALTGEPSAVDSLTWTRLRDQPVALNDTGDYAFTGIAGAPPGVHVLVRNGVVLARQGDVLPAIAPYALTKLSGGASPSDRAPLRISQDGRVLWFGSWDDPDTTRNSGLFLDHELIVQKGVTQVGGVTIRDFFGLPFFEGAFDISADGKVIYVRADLVNFSSCLFAISLEGGVETIPGCAPNVGKLDSLGTPNLGEPVVFSIAGGQSASALPFVFLSTKPAVGSSPCGIAVPGIGEVLIDVAAPNPLALIKGNNVLFPFPSFAVLDQVPQLPQLLGKTFYAQGLWLDVANPNPANVARLTNALSLSIGY